MIRPNFLTSAERADLEKIVRRSSGTHGVARRANAILLLDDGLSCEEIAKYLYLDDDTVRSWYKSFEAGGTEELRRFNHKGGRPFLNEAQEAELCRRLSARACRDTNEIRALIRDLFKIDYSRSGCIKLLHRLGFEYKKPKVLPRVASEAEQKAFIDAYEKMMRTLPEDEAVYFADAVHPEYQSRPAYGWMKKGQNVALPTTSGRKRVNIHGAICLDTFDVATVEADVVNAESAIKLLEKIEARNPDKKRIRVIWDGAPYHRSKEIKKWLARDGCRIKLMPLPYYCPHLNPIERLWGVMHGYVTHNKFYETYEKFVKEIRRFFAKSVPKNWKKFRDKVTDNFRVISYQNFRVLG